MAEENTGSGAASGAGTQTQASAEGTGPTTKDLEARATKAEQEAARLQGQLDALQPYIRFDQTSPETRTTGQDQSQGQDDDPAVRLDRAIKNVDQKASQIHADTMREVFFARNPDLEPYEGLVSHMMANETDPRKPPKDRLNDAAKKAREWIKSERDKGRTEEREASTKKAKETAPTAGVLEGSHSSSAPEEDAGWKSNDDYAAARRAGRSPK